MEQTFQTVLLVLVMGLGRLCKRVAGVRASAPAFVFFSILFVWAVYISVVRRVISSLLDIVINIEMIMVLIGLCSIMLSDPGFLTHHSCAHLSVIDEIESQGEELKVSTSVAHQEPPTEEVGEFTRYRRVRYCRYCKNYVMGLDHHCPAFGNCIGQRNHALFLVLVVGFAISEASFVVCASHFTTKSETSKEVGEKANTSRNLVVGTALFCMIQVLWQVVFIVWHVHCACFNIKTDEWINWKNYPEFQSKVIPHEGQPHPDVQFTNPYDKGILRNLKEFFATDANHQPPAFHKTGRVPDVFNR
ncbi:protein S-acyltransferase [Salvia divinorum]|uniref:S-acyltransferase n=1 Tax=Salvia divinorum TaxID=28513 RepID=A0ABD1HSN1_SALDI